MSGYADVKKKRLLGFLEWLQNHKGVEIKSGGKHQTVVTIIHLGKKYPLQHHQTVDKYVIEGFMKFLVKNEVCTKEEFDSKI